MSATKKEVTFWLYQSYPIKCYKCYYIDALGKIGITNTNFLGTVLKINFNFLGWCIGLIQGVYLSKSLTIS